MGVYIANTAIMVTVIIIVWLLVISVHASS